MKGWIDRVLTLGFAYTPEKRYSNGVFKVRIEDTCDIAVFFLHIYFNLVCLPQDKKVMLSFTTHEAESTLSANGIHGDINVVLWPLQVLIHEMIFSYMYIIKKKKNSTPFYLTHTILLFLEWCPVLLWLPGSGPTDLLGCLRCPHRGP